MTGTLEELDWSVVNEVHKITVPTLLLNGRYGEAQDSAVMAVYMRLSNAKWIQISVASHIDN